MKSFDKLIGRLLFFLIFLLLAVLVIREISSYDIWFHLKAGQWILENFKVPEYDIFSYTVPSNLWLDSQWLFQVILYAAYSIGNIAGIHLLKIIFYILAFICVFKVVNKKYYIFSSVFLFITLLIIQNRFYARPEMISLFFVALYFLILHNYKHKKSNSIYILPLLQLIWTNTHGLFIIGPVMILSYMAGEFFSWKVMSKSKWHEDVPIKGKNYNKLLIIFVLMMLACFINPYGIRGVAFPFLLFTELNSKIASELQPSLSISNSNLILFCYKTLIMLTIATFFLNVKKINITNIILFCGFLFISLKAWRNISYFAVIATPIAISNMNNVSSRIIEIINSIRNIFKNTFRIMVSLILILLIMICIVNVLNNNFYKNVKNRYSAKRFGIGVSKFIYPEKAVDFIERNNIRGNILNCHKNGGYLIWRLYPHRKVFIDGRGKVYGEEFIKHHAESIRKYELFPKYLDDYNINYILFNHDSWESSIMSVPLYKNKEWELIYFDNIALIFIRNIEQNRKIIENNPVDFSLLIKGYNKNDDGIQSYYVAKGMFFFSTGFYDNGEYELKRAIDLNQKDSMAYYNRGTVYNRIGYFDKAIDDFNKTIELNPKFYHAYNNRGIVYKTKGFYNMAIVDFGKAIEINPKYLRAYQNRSITFRETGQNKLAKKDEDKIRELLKVK